VAYGGVVRDGEQVQRVVSDGVIAAVITSKSTHNAHSVILAAGPWTSRLTEPLGLSLPLQVVRSSLSTDRPDKPTRITRKKYAGISCGRPSRPAQL